MKLALITGATGGLGQALAHLLASKKIPLFLTARDPNLLKDLAETLSNETSVEWLAVDLSNDVKTLLLAIEKKAPDLIINNAGFGLYGELIDLNEQAEMIDVNVTSLVQITQKAAQTLIGKGQRGTILNISSAAAYFIMPYFATYCASKAFVRIFSEALDEELSTKGIRILVSCPGQIATPFRKRAARGIIQNDHNTSMTPEKAASLLWKQIEQGKQSTIIDLRYRIMVALSHFLPKKWLQRRLATAILARIQKDSLS